MRAGVTLILVFLVMLNIEARAATPAELMRRADAEIEVGHGAEAIALWQQALADYRQAGDLTGQSRALKRIGETSKLMDRPDEAVSALAEALRLSRRTGNSSSLRELLDALTEAADDARDPSPAIDAARELLAIAEASGDTQAASRAAARLGGWLLDAGNPKLAAVALRRAAELFHTVGNRRNENVALFKLGRALLKTEDYISAADAFHQAESIARQSHNFSLQARSLKGQGDARYLLGDYPGAIEALNAAIHVATREGDRDTEGSAQISLGNVYYFLSENEKSVQCYQQALAAAKALNDRAFEGEALGNLAGVYSHMGQHEQAAEYRRQDVAIARELRNQFVEAQALGNLGVELMQQGKYAEAIPVLEQGVAISLEIGYKRGVSIMLRNLGKSQLGMGKPGLAEAAFRKAILAQEELREQAVADDAHNVSLFETQLEAYGDLQTALIAQNKTEAALEVSEAGRARAMADLLAGRGGASAKAPSPRFEEIQGIARSRRVTLVEFSMSDTNGKHALYIWVVKPDGSVAFHYGAINDLLFQPNLIELMLKELTGKRGNLDSAFRALVNKVRKDVGEPSKSPSEPKPATDGQELLAIIYRALIAPISEDLPSPPNEPVVLIPHGSLFLLPWAALPDRSGRPLAEAHTLLLAPSIQTLGLFSRPTAAENRPALVVGNPATSSVHLSPSNKMSVEMPPLPLAEREAMAVASILRTKPLLGPAASREAVLARMPEAGIIHLATHGVSDDVRGKGIPGALVVASGPLGDGLIATPEIMNLRLNAALVVLSACDTGLGKLSSDGVIGLSRAFLVAGAKNVIVSLWRVADEPTAELMTAFYTALSNGQAPAPALRQAMLETRNAHPHPSAWAGFILMGSGDDWQVTSQLHSGSEP
jgi:CHAT domain-containing protein